MLEQEDGCYWSSRVVYGLAGRSPNICACLSEARRSSNSNPSWDIESSDSLLFMTGRLMERTARWWRLSGRHREGAQDAEHHTSVTSIGDAPTGIVPSWVTLNVITYALTTRPGIVCRSTPAAESK